MDDTPFVRFQKSGIIFIIYSPLNLLLYLYSLDCAEDIFCLISASCREELPHCYLPPSVGNEQLLKVCFCKQAASAEQGEQCGTLHSLNSSWARSWPSPTHFKCIPDICLEITSAGLRTTALWQIWRSALRNNNSEAEGIHRWVLNPLPQVITYTWCKSFCKFKMCVTLLLWSLSWEKVKICDIRYIKWLKI